MEQPAHTILYFGDQTDAWIDGIDQLHRQAATTPWLQSLLAHLVRVYKEESRGMDTVLQDSMGDYSTLQDLADRYRHSPDQLGMVHALLLHSVRAAMLLQWAKREPSILYTTASGSQPERLGISGGLTNLSALAISTGFESLYEAVVVVARMFVRLCRFTSVHSRAIEDRPGVWGYAVLGVEPDELRKVLAQFQHTMGIPAIKRARIGVTGDQWSTVIGCPSVLDLCMKQCPAMKNFVTTPLRIHALQHVVAVSEGDLDYIVGNSPLLDREVLPNFKVWGLEEPTATYSNWGSLLRTIVAQVLSQPLDLISVVEKLISHMGARKLNVKVIGPSSHTPYLASAFKAAGSTVNFQYDKSLEQASSPRSEGIAIVGISARGPGSNNHEEFWDVIMSKQDRCEEIPPDRFDIESYYCTEHKDYCTTTTRFGCFMKDPGAFDPRFFHVSPREAMMMDPGHRQFLMRTYEALEMAGYSNGRTKAINPNRIATFYGQSNDDWHIMSHDTFGCSALTLQGAQRAFGAGRVAYKFGWEGPTYSLDSACASTTSGMHLACMSLLAHDVDMAVVGAANIVGYPHSWTSLSKSGVLSSTGNCKAYRDDADGYCRADFVGSVVLKRLADAEVQNDNILAVVSGSGRNHSGNSTSITTADPNSQGRLFQKVMQDARVTPNDLSFIETHGTGTQVGDYAEMTSLATISKYRKKQAPLPIGSVKANLGHSEAASGMASLLKSILMFQKNILPPQAGLPHTLNSRYPPLAEINVEIPSEPREFPSPKQKSRRILMNNFDAAGGNACLILEDWVHREVKTQDPRPVHVVAVSAKTPNSFRANKRRLLDWLQANLGMPVEHVAYTTTARRMHHPIRAAYAASSIQELETMLNADTSEPSPARDTRAVFLFTGQGSQVAGLGHELYSTCSVFREKVDLCASICEEHQLPQFLDIITSPNADLSSKSPVETQLALVTLEVGLAEFWRSAGVEPSMVIGHSLGEYAALHVAGVLSLADMLYLVGSRARLLVERCEPGAFAMLAVSAPPSELQKIIVERPNSSLEIACRNSPNSTAVSGTVDDVEKLRKDIGPRTHTSVLPVPYGFHSFQMDSVLEDYKRLALGVTYSVAKVPVASTLLGKVVDTLGIFGADYLAQQTRQTVDFEGAIASAKQALGDPFWLEIGAGHTCGAFVRATVSPTPTPKATLEKGSNAWKTISQALEAAYRAGIDIDWLAFHAPYKESLRLLDLPSYAWDLKDYWITYSEPQQQKVSASDSTPLRMQTQISTCAQYVVEGMAATKDSVALGAGITEPEFEALIDSHRIREVPVCPGSAFCEAGMAAAQHLMSLRLESNMTGSVLALQGVSLKLPLTRRLAGPQAELRTTARTTVDHKIAVSWKACPPSGTGYDLGSCQVAVCDAGKLQAVWDKTSHFVKASLDRLVNAVKAGSSGHRFQPGIFYSLFANTVQYDPAFKCLQEAFIADGFQEGVARVQLQSDPPGTKFAASPYWGEALVQIAGFLLNANPDRQSAKTTCMMQSFESFEQTIPFRAGHTYLSYARVSQTTNNMITCDVYVFHGERLIMQCSGLQFHEVSNATLDRLLGKSTAGLPEGAQPKPVQQAGTDSVSHKNVSTTAPAQTSGQHSKGTPSTKPNTEAPMHNAIAAPTQEKQLHEPDASGFHKVLEVICEQTGATMSDLEDDNTAFADLGVDSIMSIEISSKLAGITDPDILPSFALDFPTIGDLRTAFGGSSASAPSTESVPSGSQTPASSSTSISDAAIPDPTTEAAQPTVTENPPKASKTLPKARITLMSGRRSSTQPPLYLIADGTGSIATYLHLPPFKSKMPVYGIQSPFMLAPSDLTTEIGIPGYASIIVEALLKAQPEGPFSIGGFSGGAMVSYEVCRQVAAAGRSVSTLLLIDMCCPRKPGAEGLSELGWKVYESIARSDSLWTSSDLAQQHLRAMFDCVATYHPPSMAADERPKRTAMIWASQGMIKRCSSDAELMRLLSERGIPTDSYPGFMEDPKMGAIAWGLPNKTPADLGPNGWDEYLGEMLCLSVAADHLELPMPGHVHLLHKAMEEAFVYLTGPNE